MEPFTYQWGPRHLAGLGVRLEPDQAAVTEVPGYALAIQPVWDPLMNMTGFGGKPSKKVWDHRNGGYLYRPVVLQTTLNDVLDNVPHHDTLQDVLDETCRTAEEWRTYAAGAGQRYDQAFQWFALDCDYGDEMAYSPQSAWDMVMIDQDQADRAAKAIEWIWARSHFPTLEHFCSVVDGAQQDGELLMCQYADDEDEDLTSDAACEIHVPETEGWFEICHELGVEPSSDPNEQMLPDTAGLVLPVWEFDDHDINKAWKTLVESSRKGWSQLATIQNPRNRSQWKHLYRKEQAWF